MGQRIYFWIFLGLIGAAAFFTIRPGIDINAGAPIELDRAAIEAKTGMIAEQLGFSTDTLGLMSVRTQHLNFYRALKDSVGGDLPGPAAMNRLGVNLTGWKVMAGNAPREEFFVGGSLEDLYRQAGRVEFRFDHRGKITRIRGNAQRPNPTFVAGDSLHSIAHHLVEDILGYDLSQYELSRVDVKDSLAYSTEPGFENRPLNFTGSSVGSNTVYHWVRKDAAWDRPEELVLEITPVIREMQEDVTTRVRFGASIQSFEAQSRYQPANLDESSRLDSLALFITFGAIGLLFGMVLFQGIKFINKGHVDWKRAFFILIAVFVGIFIWRVIFLLNMWEPFLNENSVLLYLLNQLIFGIVVGLYAALAYIGWEAIARKQNQGQVRLLDAFWKRRFYFRETGDSIIRGFSLGGALLGLFAITIWLLNTVYYQSDSQFGYTEASMQPKVLTLNISAWLNVVLVALGHIGLAASLLQVHISRRWLFYAAAVPLTGLLLAGPGPMVGIVGPAWQDLVVFAALTPAVLFAFRSSGLVTFAFGWWVFSVVLLITPYLGSPDIGVAYIGWVQGAILLMPLLYGFLAYRNGKSVFDVDLGGYLPAYQEKMDNHLRVEKEIEIARESQFKLMPLQPPVAEGIDVYGFFMPSFEVGGDYFDYVLSKNGSADANGDALTMTIADVSGKSMKAAMHAVFTSGLLLSRLYKDSPEAILREVAPTLHTRTDPQTFITCIIARYHIKSRTLNIANAGHCLPVLKRKNKAEFIKTPDPKFPLGFKSDINYRLLETRLEPGDFLLLYSDGLPEAQGPGGERFGYENMTGLVESIDTGALSSYEIALEIKRRIQKFSDYQLADDTTIICLKI